MVRSAGLPTGPKDPMLCGVLWLTALNCPLSPETVSAKDSSLPQAKAPS